MEANVKTGMGRDRYRELKRILQERQLEIIAEMQHKMRDVRSEGAAVLRQGVRDEAESSEAETRDDVEFALLQLKTETLENIGKALARLDQGGYGYCCECGAEIAEQRLRALPFAVRCRNCEEVREAARQRECAPPARRTVPSLLADVIG